MTLLLDLVPGTGKNAGNFVFSDFGEALLYALIGFVIVFAGIAIIIAVIWLIGLLMRKTDNLAFLTKKKDKSKNAGADIVANEPHADGDDIPEEIKAAIVAAVMSYYQTEKPKCDFIVKRIKRI